MIELLDELTEIPFDIFWEKYLELHPGNFSKLHAEAIWFKMLECNRILAFEKMLKGHELFNSPKEYLNHFDLPF